MTGINSMLSWRLAPVRVTASGRPFRSTTIWRFVPIRPRSVGLGPIASPPFSPPPTRNRHSPVTSRSGPPNAGVQAYGDEGGPKGQHPAKTVIDANRSCQSNLRPHEADVPMQCRYREQTISLSAPPVHRQKDDRRADNCATAEKAGLGLPINRLEQVSSPYRSLTQ